MIAKTRKKFLKAKCLVLDVGGIRITNDTGAGFVSLTTEDGYGVSIQPEDLEGIIEALQQSLEEYSSVKPENRRRRSGEYYDKGHPNRRSTDGYDSSGMQGATGRYDIDFK